MSPHSQRLDAECTPGVVVGSRIASLREQKDEATTPGMPHPNPSGSKWGWRGTQRPRTRGSESNEEYSGFVYCEASQGACLWRQESVILSPCTDAGVDGYRESR